MRDIPYEMYIAGLLDSNTGRRLVKMLPVSIFEVIVVNGSPKVGNDASSKYPMDEAYIADVLRIVSPDVIVACGQVADEGLTRMKIDHWYIPHPMRRDLSNQDFEEIRETLKEIMS